ncbi:MAG: hypothetical protein HW403_603 [Dehalococcoidia bacterium]|nr:hypothetical protein [Dehalococcoidia bacterium]
MISAKLGVANRQHVATLEVVPMANAVTVVALLVYVLCRVLSLVAPEVLATVARSWFHGLAVGTAPWPGFQGGEFLLGLVTIGIFAWVTTASTAWLYKQWDR